MNNERPTLSEMFDLNWSDIIVVVSVLSGFGIFFSFV